MENHLVRSIGESRLLTPYRISQLIVISERFLVSRTFIMKRSKRLKRGSRRISLTKRKCRFRCNVCNLCSREADLRFGSVDPKNGFLSLSLFLSLLAAFPRCRWNSAIRRVAFHPRGMYFFRDDNYERNLLFRSLLPPLPFPRPFIYRVRALCPVGTALSRKKRFCCSFSGPG